MTQTWHQNCASTLETQTPNFSRDLGFLSLRWKRWVPLALKPFAIDSNDFPQFVAFASRHGRSRLRRSNHYLPRGCDPNCRLSFHIVHDDQRSLWEPAVEHASFHTCFFSNKELFKQTDMMGELRVCIYELYIHMLFFNTVYQHSSCNSKAFPTNTECRRYVSPVCQQLEKTSIGRDAYLASWHTCLEDKVVLHASDELT